MLDARDIIHISMRMEYPRRPHYRIYEQTGCFGRPFKRHNQYATKYTVAASTFISLCAHSNVYTLQTGGAISMLRDRARSKAWYCLYETMEDDLILLLTCALGPFGHNKRASVERAIHVSPPSVYFGSCSNFLQSFRSAFKQPLATTWLTGYRSSL